MATFEGRVLSYSAKAVWFEGVYWGAPLWLPRSQVEIIPDEDSHVVILKDWLANKRGLYEFTEYTPEQIQEIDAK